MTTEIAICDSAVQQKIIGKGSYEETREYKTGSK